MVKTNAQKKAIDAIAVMNVAITNLRLYPPTSAIIENSINRVFQLLADILKHENSVVYAESGNDFIICDRFFSEQNQKNYPHARAFLELLRKVGVRSVSFEKRLTKPEVKAFLNLVSGNSEKINPEEGLRDSLAQKNLPNIVVERDGNSPGLWENPDAGTPERTGVDQAHSFRMRSGGGGRLADRIQRLMAKEKRRVRERDADLKAELQSILQGEEAPFLNDRVMEGLPEHIGGLYKGGKGDVAEMLLLKLSQKLCHEDPEIRKSVSLSLFLTGRILISEGWYPALVKRLPDLLQWMKLETGPPTVGYKGIVTQLQELARKLIEDGGLLECNAVLETLGQIRFGEEERDEEIRHMAEEALRDIATEGVLDLLLQGLQSSVEERRKQAVRGLILLSGIAIERLLDFLQDSPDMAERVRILNGVSEMGETAVPMLVQKIREGGSWFYLRNLILMLGKVGTEKEVAVLQPYLKHEDFRVQREALNSIYHIGGKFREPALLAALADGEERLKINIVDMLGAMKSQEAVNPLLELFQSKSFFSKKTSDKLKAKICSALGRIGSEKAVPVLRAVAERKGLLRIKSYPEAIREAASTALIQIDKLRPQKNEFQDEGFEKTRIGADAAADRGMPNALPSKQKSAGIRKASAQADASEPNAEGLTDDFSLPFFSPSEKTVNRNNDTIEETAVLLLYQAIVVHACKKEFKEAEALRQQLIDLDAMALTEIIRAGEIIEAMKRDSGKIEPDHLEIWSDLFDSLSPEEADGLYYAMKEGFFEADEPVFKQGSRNDRLIFIRQGQLRQVFSRGEREILIKTVGKSEVVGEDTFFSASVCTTSLVALSLTKVNFIEKQVLDKWRRQFPALESKLHDYCLRREKVHEILKNKGMDRRLQNRVELSGIASIHLLSPEGKPTGKIFRGGLLDISLGGLSFLIKAANRRNVSLLLGRKLDMQFEVPAPLLVQLNIKWPNPPGKKPFRVRRVGMVIGVNHRLEEDYSVHLKFEKSLEMAAPQPAAKLVRSRVTPSPAAQGGSA